MKKLTSIITATLISMLFMVNVGISQNLYTGTITAASSSCTSANCVMASGMGENGTFGIQITGTITATLKFEGTIDGTNWFSVTGVVPGTMATATEATAVGNWIVSGTSIQSMRVRASAYSSGPVTVTILSSKGPGLATAASVSATVDTTGLATETTLGTVHGHVDSIDSKTPALGQALAAASVPVILPTATISTLTPPAAITGFATATLQGAGLPAALAADGGLKTSPATADGADGAAITNPGVPITGRVRVTEPAAVDAGDALTATESSIGGQLVHVGALPQNRWQATGGATPLADTTAISVRTHTDGMFTVVTSLLITNSDATVGTVVSITSGTGTVCGTGNAVLWSGYAAPAGGGFAISNPEGLFSTPAAADDLCIINTTTSAEVIWSASGFKTALDRVE